MSNIPAAVFVLHIVKHIKVYVVAVDVIVGGRIRVNINK